MANQLLQAQGTNISPARTTVNFQSANAQDNGTTVLSFPHIWTINIPAMSALANGQSFKFTPGYNGVIKSISFTSTTAITTAAKAATFTPKVATVAVTGGALALTSANATTTVGTEVLGAAITGANAFTAAQQISVDVSAVTAFAEGAGQLQVVLS